MDKDSHFERANPDLAVSCSCRKKLTVRTELYSQYIDVVLDISIHEDTRIEQVNPNQSRGCDTYQIFDPVSKSFMYVFPSLPSPTASLCPSGLILTHCAAEPYVNVCAN